MKKIMYIVATITALISHNLSAENNLNSYISLSEERIQQAEKAYAAEAQWHTQVRILAGIAACAGTAYMLYHYLFKQTTPTLSTKEKEELALIGAAYLKQKAEEAALEKTKKKDALETFLDLAYIIKNGSSWIISSLLYQLAAFAIMGAGTNMYNAIKRAFPTKGSLSWYIVSRTNYTAVANLLYPQELISSNNALPFIAEPYLAINSRIKHTNAHGEIAPLMQLFIGEIEKIIGYLRYTSNNIEMAANNSTIQNLCKKYTQTITETLQDLVESYNRNPQAIDDVSVIINRIASEIQRATILIDAFN